MLVVGGIAGGLASMLMRTNGQQGIILNIVVGIIGGFLGGWLLPMVGLSFGGWIGYLVTALIGAVILLAIVNLFRRGSVRCARVPAVAKDPVSPGLWFCVANEMHLILALFIRLTRNPKVKFFSLR